MYESFTSNKLQDNAESSDTFINKAVLTVASYTRTIYYKYNRIPVFYHLPFAFMETNLKWVYLNILFFYVTLIVFFYLYVYIFGDLFKVILPLSFCIALWDIYYMHLVWEDIENDLNMITDSFQIYFLNFLNVLAMVFLWRQVIQLMKQKVKKSDSKLLFIP